MARADGIPGCTLAGEAGRLLGESLAHERRQEFAAAESTARAALVELSRRPPVAAGDSACVLTAIFNPMFQSYRVRGTDALALAERAVALRRRGGDSALVADALARLALVQMDAQFRDEADRSAREALAIASSPPLRGTESEAFARYALGNACISLREYARGLPEMERAWAIRRRVQDAGDPRLMRAARNVATLREMTDDVPGAGRARDSALVMARRSLPPGHTLRNAILLDVGRQYGLEGRFVEAEAVIQEATRGIGATLGTNNPLYGNALNQLGWVQHQIGDAGAAMSSYERSAEVLARTQGPRSLFVLNALANAAGEAVFSGNAVHALAILDSAAARTRAAGLDNSATARDLSDSRVLALTSLGRWDEALAEARALRRACVTAGLGNSYEGLLAMGREASVFKAMGRIDSATALARARRDSAATHLGRVHRSWQAAAEEYAELRMTAEPESSAAFFADEIELLRARLGPQSVSVGRAQAILARARAALGDTAAALALALDAERTGREGFRITARGLSEREALAAANVRARGLDVALGLLRAGALDTPASVRVWDELVRSRALVLEEAAARRHWVGQAMDSLDARCEHARAAHARLLSRGPQSDPAAYRVALETAAAEEDRAERERALAHPADRADELRRRAGLDDAIAALPRGTALLSYVRYAVVMSAGARSWRWAAFVRGSDGAKSFVPLGGAAGIDEAVTRWRRELATPVPADPHRAALAAAAVERAGLDVRRRLWDPLARALPASGTVVVVADGDLALLPFDALPAGAGRFLVDTPVRVVTLESERDLLPRPNVNAGRGLLAVGGPDFDLAPGGDAPPGVAPGGLRGPATCREYMGLHFAPLPAARREAFDVARAFTASGDADTSSSRVLAGAEATETAFRANVRGRRAVHLATHGFFVDPLCGAAADPDGRGVAGVVADRPATGSYSVDALRLSGLAFAGANVRDAATDAAADGVLTAGEVAALDLDGIELVTLSACQSGVGEVIAGEGVLGFDRALRVAGARTLVLSLWSVPDAAASAWMADFYRALWSGHRGAEAAAREATLRRLDALRRDRTPAHPGRWAMFVVRGDGAFAAAPSR